MESIRTQPRNVTMIPPTMRMHTSAPLSQTAIRRVAGYARVSTDNEEQQTSYDAQMDYYKRFITEHEGWRFIGLYSDEGISGTSIRCILYEGSSEKAGSCGGSQMELDNVKTNLQQKGYEVSVFDTGADAVRYLKGSITGKTIGFGGSQTLTALNLRNELSENNTLYVPDFPSEGETFRGTAVKTMDTDLFFLSANAVSEDGEIVNIDGTGNRLAGSLFGHQKVCYIIGQNKIGGTLEQAVSRARNVASPKNALRLHCETPCSMAVAGALEKRFRETHNVTGDIDQLEWQRFIEGLDAQELGTHCYDCKSSQRICGSLLIHLTKPHSMKVEIIIVKQDLGF